MRLNSGGGGLLPESFVQMYAPAAQFLLSLTFFRPRCPKIDTLLPVQLSTPHMTHIKAGKQGVRDGEVSSIIILNVGLDYAPFNGS